MAIRILLLTDKKENRIRDRLSAFGYRSLDGDSNKGIYENILDLRPDAVLLNREMTKDELESFLSRLRSGPLKDTPVIVFLSKDEKEKEELLSGLLYQHIFKPVDIDELQSKINASLRIMALQKEVDSKNKVLAYHVSLSKELAEFSRRINCLSLPDIIKIIKKEIPLLLSVKYFLLYLYDKNKDSLKNLTHNYKRLAKEKNIILNASSDDVWGTFISKQNKFFMEKRLLIIPLYIEKTLLGILVLKEPHRGEFFEEDIFEANRISQHMASAIRNCEMYQEIENLSITDGLTGLYNYRYFQSRLSEELKRVKRSKRQCSIVLMDIDHFKKINDAHGHTEGNRVLVEFVNLIKIGLRGFDIAARYGGEEFVLFLPDTRLEEAVIVAERTRKRVLDHDFSKGDFRLRMTVSMGVTTYAYGDGIDQNELLEEADRFLYKAKRSGRNRVCYPKYIIRKPKIETGVSAEEKEGLF